MAGYKVLLVEDNPIWVDILERRMRLILQNIGHPDDPVITVSDFEKAYNTLKEQSWNLLVTDIGLGDSRESLKKKGKHLLSLALELGVPSVVVSGTSGLTRRDVWDLSERYHVSYFFDKLDFDEEKFIVKVEELLKIQNDRDKESQYPTENELPSQLSSADQMQSFYALLIGIAKYSYINPLSKTTNDARDLYNTFIENGYPQQNLALLLDQDATKVAISKELDQLARCAKTNDTVVIFFSGHGARMIGGLSPGEYLCPVEAEINRVKDTCISDAEFTAALRATNAGRLVVFLDACHSGGVGEPKDPDVRVKVGLSEEAYSKLATTGKGRVIIASCKADEVSWELPGMQNGLFTHYLLEGLRGKAARNDGTVWITNLFGYISEHVSKHKPQHPFQKSATEDFPIARTQQSHSISLSSSSPSTSTNLLKTSFDSSLVDPTSLREAIRKAYNLPRFRLLCQDLKFNYEDFQGETLMEKVAFLVEECQRFRCYDNLVQKVLNAHPYLIDDLK
jgi:Caspase domain